MRKLWIALGLILWWALKVTAEEILPHVFIA